MNDRCETCIYRIISEKYDIEILNCSSGLCILEEKEKENYGYQSDDNEGIRIL